MMSKTMNEPTRLKKMSTKKLNRVKTEKDLEKVEEGEKNYLESSSSDENDDLAEEEVR